MPFLPAEPFVYPEKLLEEPAAHPCDGQWWVLYTKPRAEKSLARRLHGRGVPYFLPLYKRKYTSAGRTFTGFLPLFPGYLFLFGGYDERLHALETNLVSRTIAVNDQASFLSDITGVYNLMNSGFALAPEEKLPPGTPVEIISGPLNGVRGKILGAGKKKRFAVEVRFLQCGVSVEMDAWMIRPASVN